MDLVLLMLFQLLVNFTVVFQFLCAVLFSLYFDYTSIFILLGDGRVLTVVGHSNQLTTNVNGFQEAGTFRQDIVYTASTQQLEALLNRSQTCRQRLSYSCFSSRLLNSPSEYFHSFYFFNH